MQKVFDLSGNVVLSINDIKKTTGVDGITIQQGIDSPEMPKSPLYNARGVTSEQWQSILLINKPVAQIIVPVTVNANAEFSGNIHFKDINNEDIEIPYSVTITCTDTSNVTFLVNSSYNGIDQKSNNVNTRFKANYYTFYVYAFYTSDSNGNFIGLTYTLFYRLINNAYPSGFMTYDLALNWGFTNEHAWNSTIMSVPLSLNQREADTSGTIEPNGGYGTGTMPRDNVNIPTIPNINFSNVGATLYMLSAPQIKSFRDWLWSSDWADNIKKIQSSPMENILSVALTDIPNLAGINGVIAVGNIVTELNATVITNNFVELNCGEINLSEMYGSFADYEPYIATTLYIPKVGFIQIPADIVVNNTIKVVYHIELSTGEGLCYVLITSNREQYSYIWNTYTCKCISNIQMSAKDYTQQLVALGNAIVNTTASVSGAVANGGATTASAITSVASNALNVATTKNPTQTKGNFGNMGGILCFKKPYLLINRTNIVKPESFEENNGYLIYYTAKIGNHTGYLQTHNYHCSFNAPYNHRAEIERLMDGGVIINA